MKPPLWHYHIWLASVRPLRSSLALAQRLNSPALRGFMRKVQWNDGLARRQHDITVYLRLRVASEYYR